MTIVIDWKKNLIPIPFAILSSFFILLNLPFFAFSIAFSIILFVILIKKMEYGLYLIAIWVPLQYFLTNYYTVLPRNFVWLDEVLVFIMFLITIAKIVTSKSKPSISIIDKFIALFLLVATISGMLNLVNPVIGAMGVRAFLQYYLLYFVIKNAELNETIYKNLIIIVFITIIIQIPLAIYQFFTWKPQYLNFLTGGYVNKFGLSHYDAVVGTFGVGAANNFGYLIVMVILLLLAAYIYLKRRIYLVMAFLFIIPLVFAQARGAYVVAVLAFCYAYRKNLFIFKNVAKLFMVIILFILLFSISAHMYFKHSKYKFEELFNVDSIIKQQMTISQGSSGRLIGIKIANDILSEKAPSRLIGVGPGMFSSSTGMFFSVPRYIETVNKLHSNRCITESDIVPVMTEYGYLGLIVFIFLIISMLKKNIDIYKRTTNKYLKAICFGGDGVLFIFLIGGLLTKIWEVQYIAFYIWLYMGCVENISMEKEDGAIS